MVAADSKAGAVWDTACAMLQDGQSVRVRVSGQDWLLSWHPPPTAPAGAPHGAAGICVTERGDIVLISADGLCWDLPAGRPEAGETWEQTLRREMREEACVTVVDAHLLGFSRGICVAGPQAGLVLVRSFWLAQVQLGAWEPQFEIAHRRTVPFRQIRPYLPSVYQPIFRRAFAEAGMIIG